MTKPQQQHKAESLGQEERMAATNQKLRTFEPKHNGNINKLNEAALAEKEKLKNEVASAEAERIRVETAAVTRVHEMEKRR